MKNKLVSEGLELVLGGARSGKSGYALELAKMFGDSVTWIATAEPYDGEMVERITKHKAERPTNWQTIESPLHLSAALSENAKEGHCIVVDCLTLWLSNWLCKEDSDGFLKERQQLMSSINTLPGRIILVSNEVGWSIVPENALSRKFRDAAGRLHQDLAALSKYVTLVVAGIPMKIKGHE